MKNTIEIVKLNCTGCRACEQICPKNAITMKENEEGFLYPTIDKSKCINCGLCIEKCHAYKNIDLKEPNICLALKPVKADIAKKSTSGGLAYLLSSYFVNNGGIVYGSVYDKELYVKHVRVDNIEDVEKLRGSKYVISDTLDTFSQVKNDLYNNKNVLYIGTACQIAGLKNFLGKHYENLFLIDIVCHGTPSAKIFKKYIEYLEKKYKAKVIEYQFRNKEKKQWGIGYTAKITLKYADGKINKKYIKADFDPYYSNFLKGNINRESCYLCKYASYMKRPADLTIGDFWGIEKIDSTFYDKNGVSLCIVNTEKGKKLLNCIDREIISKITQIKDAILKNGNLIKSMKRPRIRDKSYQDIDKVSNIDFFERNLKTNKSLKIIIKNIMPTRIRMIYKKYGG